MLFKLPSSYTEPTFKHIGVYSMLFVLCGLLAVVAVGGIITTLAGIATHKIHV